MPFEQGSYLSNSYECASNPSDSELFNMNSTWANIWSTPSQTSQNLPAAGSTFNNTAELLSDEELLALVHVTLRAMEPTLNPAPQPGNTNFYSLQNGVHEHLPGYSSGHANIAVTGFINQSPASELPATSPQPNGIGPDSNAFLFDEPLNFQNAFQDPLQVAQPNTTGHASGAATQIGSAPGRDQHVPSSSSSHIGAATSGRKRRRDQNENTPIQASGSCGADARPSKRVRTNNSEALSATRPSAEATSSGNVRSRPSRQTGSRASRQSPSGRLPPIPAQIQPRVNVEAASFQCCIGECTLPIGTSGKADGNTHVYEHHCPSGDKKTIVRCNWQMGDSVCDAEMQISALGRHIVDVHGPPHEVQCTIPGCTWSCGSRKDAGQRHVREKHEELLNFVLMLEELKRKLPILQA
ncbi:hypothetical protein AcV7_005382 [Taiwanofungus camphoratus]|nr:hypothetical protein AcV7_005382 [Antrodia cinnamomea]